MSTPVRFGFIYLPVREEEGVHEVLARSVALEELGVFHTLWHGDLAPVNKKALGLELIVRLAAVVARTQSIRVGVSCMASFATRDPLYVAAQWASLDILAGPGRMVLAVCQGQPGRFDWELEEAAFGVRWGNARVRRMEEGIEVLRSLWTQEQTTYQGKYLQYEQVAAYPRPLTKPHPPIWIAANPRPKNGDTSAIDRMIQRVARLADGWMTALISAENFGRQWQRISQALVEAGRDPAKFETCLYYNVNVNDDSEAAFAEARRWHEAFYHREWPRPLLENWVAYGSPQQVADKLQSYVEAGVKEFVIRLSGFDQERQLQQLVEGVIPLFR